MYLGFILKIMWIKGDKCSMLAYNMQLIAAVMTKKMSAKTFAITGEIAIRYDASRNSLVRASLCGLSHPHYTESYYALSNHVSVEDFR